MKMYLKHCLVIFDAYYVRIMKMLSFQLEQNLNKKLSFFFTADNKRPLNGDAGVDY